MSSPSQGVSQPAPSGSSGVGTGCLILFALPFAGGGLFAAFQFISKIRQGPDDWQQVILLGIFALVFTGAGFGLIFWARYGKKQAEEAERLQQQYPEQPWMWEPEWASGRITGSNKNTMVFTWVFATFWNLVSAPVLFFLPEEIDKGNHLAWIGLIFPLAGAGLLVWAIRATLRWRKFGSSVFEMAALPGVIGGRLRGTLQTGLKSLPAGGIRLTLTSVHRRESSGSDSSNHESILWQDDQTVPRDHLAPGYQGTTVPVEFHIPSDCQPTDKSDSCGKILWRLEAAADVSGIDYQTRFEVPVFKTAESSAEAAPRHRFSSLPRSGETFDPARATIPVRTTPDGGTEYYFGAARNLGAAVSTTIFLVIFGGALWFQFYVDIPILFPIVTGLLTLLLFFITIGLWFSTSRVVIGSGSVRIMDRTLGIGGTKEIPCSDITEVKLGISMQQQPTATQSGRAYYDIELHRKHGRKVNAGRHFRNKREAQWVAAQMKKQIEVYR